MDRINTYKEWILESFEVIQDLLSDNIYLFTHSDSYNNIENLIDLNNRGIINEINLLKGYIEKYKQAIKELGDQ